MLSDGGARETTHDFYLGPPGSTISLKLKSNKEVRDGMMTRRSVMRKKGGGRAGSTNLVQCCLTCARTHRHAPKFLSSLLLPRVCGHEALIAVEFESRGGDGTSGGGGVDGFISAERGRTILGVPAHIDEFVLSRTWPRPP